MPDTVSNKEPISIKILDDYFQTSSDLDEISLIIKQIEAKKHIFKKFKINVIFLSEDIAEKIV